LRFQYVKSRGDHSDPNRNTNAHADCDRNLHPNADTDPDAEAPGDRHTDTAVLGSAGRDGRRHLRRAHRCTSRCIVRGQDFW
jgi:hypothetical protein